MATEPHTLDAASFLNHVRTVLDASLQRWEFVDFTNIGDYSEAEILFLGTGRRSVIFHSPDLGWVAEDDGKPNDRLTGLLNGRKRDDSGNLTAEPLQVEAGKFYQRRDGAVVGPAKEGSGYKEHPWIVAYYTYRHDGTQACLVGNESAVDLIREVPPPTKRDDAGVGK